MEQIHPLVLAIVCGLAALGFAVIVAFIKVAIKNYNRNQRWLRLKAQQADLLIVASKLLEQEDQYLLLSAKVEDVTDAEARKAPAKELAELRAILDRQERELTADREQLEKDFEDLRKEIAE